MQTPKVVPWEAYWESGWLHSSKWKISRQRSPKGKSDHVDFENQCRDVRFYCEENGQLLQIWLYIEFKWLVYFLTPPQNIEDIFGTLRNRAKISLHILLLILYLNGSDILSKNIKVNMLYSSWRCFIWWLKIHGCNSVSVSFFHSWKSHRNLLLWEVFILILFSFGLLASYSSNHMKPESACPLTLTLAKRHSWAFLSKYV